MADTTFVLDGRTVTLSNYTVVNDSVLDEIRKDLQLAQADTQPKNNTYSSHNNSFGFSDTIFFTFLIVLIILTYAKPPFLAKIIAKITGVTETDDQNIDEYQNTQYETTAARDYYLYNQNNLDLKHQDIETILDKYFVYYKNLDKQLQCRFFDRVLKFMNSKDFLIYSNEPFKEMPVLISAAAVQISFGLDEYELPHYQYIQVKKEEYFARETLHVLAGNVEDNSITLAWNQVLKGFSNLEDGDNVGLHEMAHALYYQEIIIEKDASDFANYFNQLMKDGEYVLEQKVCPHNLYTPYAFTNLQEFWAVSVELFFEKTPHLQTAYPNIFEHLQKLLKQNPLIPNKPVS